MHILTVPLTWIICMYYKFATWAYFNLAERPFRRYEAWIKALD